MRRRLAKFVVLGVSGNTGEVVAETLLRQKKKVRVVLHDAAKGRAWRTASAASAARCADRVLLTVRGRVVGFGPRSKPLSSIVTRHHIWRSCGARAMPSFFIRLRSVLG
jgi:hypothetical protein